MKHNYANLTLESAHGVKILLDSEERKKSYVLGWCSIIGAVHLIGKVQVQVTQVQGQNKWKNFDLKETSLFKLLDI